MAKANKPLVLVTGAGGELGQQVIRALKKHSQPVGIDFRRTSHYSDGYVHHRVDFSERNMESLFRRHEFQGVIHLGRILSGEANRQKRYNTNVLGTQRLMELSRKYELKQFMILSTYHVYGAHPYNPTLLSEDFPLKASNLSAELVDSVELENLAHTCMFKYPELPLSILRPCNVVGPGVRNAISTLLHQKRSPVLAGFSPMMQFIHVKDLAHAIVLAYEKNCPGIYNIAPADWVPYQEALALSGCQTMPLPSVPPALTRALVGALNLKAFPPHLINYYKYPVILDGQHFRDTFGFEAKHPLGQIFQYYRNQKQ